MTSPADLPARELDALVAREVMGWECDAGYAGEPIWWRGSSEFVRVADFRPSTDWRATGTVLDALAAKGWTVETWRHPGYKGDVEVNLTRGDNDAMRERVTAKGMPRAVALAALAAVGGK